jgi:hypothetical protein
MGGMIAGFALLCAPANAQLLVDDFNDNARAALWVEEETGGVTIEEVNGRVEITIPSDVPGDAVGGFGGLYVSTCKLRGDYDIQVNYTLLDWPAACETGNGVRMVLRAFSGPDPLPSPLGPDYLARTERTAFGDALSDFPGEPRNVYVANLQSEVLNITPTCARSGTLRQVRRGDRVTALVSDSTIGGFQELTSRLGVPGIDVTVSLGAGSALSVFLRHQVIKVAFDDFGINEGTLVCPGGLVIPLPAPIPIDIKPGSDPNSINLGSAGVIPVAILSAGIFDATTVVPETVSLAGAKVKLIGKSDRPLCAAEDVDADGRLDLICQVVTAQMLIEPGDSVAVLEAESVGNGVRADIRGQDSVKIVP